jgi:hypothetical protein
VKPHALDPARVSSWSRSAISLVRTPGDTNRGVIFGSRTYYEPSGDREGQASRCSNSPAPPIRSLVWRGFSMLSIGLRSDMARFAQHLAVAQGVAAARQFRLDVVELSSGPAQHGIAFLATAVRAAECCFLHVVAKSVSHLDRAPFFPRVACGHRANGTREINRMVSRAADGPGSPVVKESDSGVRSA